MVLRSLVPLTISALGLCWPAFLGAQPSATPQITAITNAASYYDAGIAPGCMVVLWGRNLGPIATVSAGSGAVGSLLPVRLSNTSVSVEGYPAPLIYVSDTQVAIIVPYEASLYRSVKVVLTNGGARSNTREIEVAAMNLGLFTSNSSGTGLAAAINQDGSLMSFGRPAQDDSYISLFATGEGMLSPLVEAGRFTNELTYSPQKRIEVYIDNRLSETSYIGVAPFSVTGFLQINAKIPRGVATGPVPVRLEAAGPYRSQNNVSLIVENRSRESASSLRIEIGDEYECVLTSNPSGFVDCKVDVNLRELRGVAFTVTGADIYESRYRNTAPLNPVISGGGLLVVPLVRRFPVGISVLGQGGQPRKAKVEISIQGTDAAGNKNFSYYAERLLGRI
jgi:uncharacterized protein (TIGR03437 family)